MKSEKLGVELELEKVLLEAGVELEASKVAKLEKFIDKLEWYNRVHNITGAKSKEAIVDNIIDSILPTTFMSEPESFLDVGTGAGFPGLILAVVWDSADCVLAEPINKRATFLRLMSQELELKNLTIFKNKVENLEHEPFSLVTSRAVTNTKLLLELTDRVCNKETEFLFYKGSRVYDEIKELNSQLKYDIVQKDKRNYLWIKQI